MIMAEKDYSDSSLGWIIIGFTVLALLYGIWFVFKVQISNAIRWVRYAEMWVIEKVLAFWKFLNRELVGREPGDMIINHQGERLSFEEHYPLIPRIPAESIDGDILAVTSVLAMEPLRMIFTVLLVIMAIWAIFKGPKTHYRRVLDLDGLIKVQSRIFPVIHPFVNFDPSDLPVRPPGSPVPAELPMFSEALGPEEWIAYNAIPMPDGKVDERAAWKAYAKQLGPPWKGATKLQPYRQVLLASFCLKAARKRDEADDILARVAQCWTDEKGLVLSHDPTLMQECKKILKNREIAEQTLDVCRQHAWENTALLRALEHARERGGVLAPAQFVWLRAFDRRLWYPLNNLGRQSFHMEALGAMAHFRLEKLIRRPMPKPNLDDAVNSIKEYMASDKARPVPALDYSYSDKRSIKKPV